MRQIVETSLRTAAEFEREVLAAAEPVVFRGLVNEWPLVQAASRSDEAACAYLQQFDRGVGLTSMVGPPDIKGRFFYNEALDGFNYEQRMIPLAQALETLLHLADQPSPPVIAVQSVPARANLPGFEDVHPMPLLAEPAEPRLWVGNRAIVAAHHDHAENIACVATGRRRFTLFPPEQVGNLYQGPFELTPARATISMVDFDNPDKEAFPRFEEALEAAVYADLAPGDAIYIPYLWWHHVRSLDSLSILVNYWFPPRGARADVEPKAAMFHAMLALRTLPPENRAAWKEMFDHYVFDLGNDAGAHLPEAHRGIMGELSSETLRSIKTSLARSLMSRG